MMQARCKKKKEDSRAVHIRNKWNKHRALWQDPGIRPYLPETEKLSRDSLASYLSRYRMVYVKPVIGTYGSGVMRVERKDRSDGYEYAYQLGRKKRRFASFDKLYRSLAHHKHAAPYLVQRGIPLLRKRGRPFDIRVMVQKNRRGDWIATGIIGRLAHPAKVVTNYHSGGTPIDASVLLRGHVSDAQRSDFIQVMKRLAQKSAISLSRAYPGINMVGADIGIDTNKRLWIIELNTHPDPYLFRHLRDRHVHLRVLRYARALGRIPARKGSRRRRHGPSSFIPQRKGNV